MKHTYFQPEVQAALGYVFRTYLIKPMSDIRLLSDGKSYPPRDFYLDSNGEQHAYPEGQVLSEIEEGAVYRMNHGLAHTVRVMSMVRDAIAYYNSTKKPKKRITKTEDFLRLEIAACFYSACRESEIAHRDAGGEALALLYRKNCARAFRQYAETAQYQGKSLFTKKNIEDYCSALKEPYGLQTPIAVILKNAHNLDLARCYRDKQLGFVENDFSRDIKLLEKAEIKLRLTGNRIGATVSRGTFQAKQIDEKTKLFQLASLHPTVTCRLMMFADVIETIESAEKFSTVLNYYAEKGLVVFEDFLDRVDNVLEKSKKLTDLIEQETQEKRGGMRFNGEGHYLPEAGPLPKNNYTIQFEQIASRLLANEKHDIQNINGQY